MKDQESTKESKNSRAALALKVKRLWLPHLLLTIAAILAATLFHAAVVYFHWSLVKETWTELVVPMLVLFAVLFLGLFIRLRRHVLNPKGDGDTWSFLMFGWVVVLPAMVVSQVWFAKAGQRLEVLGSVEELSGPKALSCVQLPSFAFDGYHPGSADDIHYSGRRSHKRLELDFFVALPLDDDTTDTIGSPVAWLVERFHDEVKASALDSEKDAAWKALVNGAIASIDSGRYDRAEYFRNEERSQHTDLFRAAIRSSQRYDPSAPMRMFSLHREPFNRETGRGLFNSLIALLGGSAAWMLFLLLIRVQNDAGAPAFTLEHVGETWRRVAQWVVPKGDLFITRTLVLLNVVAYLIVAFSGTGFLELRTYDLLAWGADHGPLTLNGEYWRLLSCMFLHGSIMHLAVNMAGLVVAGVVLEQLLGRSLFTVLYIVCGLAASCASLWWDPSRISVGASGAIFGAYGVILGLAFFSRRELVGVEVMAFFAALFVIYGLIMGSISSTTDNAAHVGGLALGLLCGLCLGVRGKFKKTEFDLPE